MQQAGADSRREKALVLGLPGSKTPLHSVIRQIPQTTVAARRVLRYNQTNLCLSA